MRGAWAYNSRVARDSQVISQTLQVFSPRGPARLAGAIDCDWIRAPVQVVDHPIGRLMVCLACVGDPLLHETYRPGEQYREITAQYLAIRTEWDLLGFVTAWGLISPVDRYIGAPNQLHVGAGAAESVDLALFSVHNARYAYQYAVRPAESDEAADARREQHRREAFAGLQLELEGMTVRFSALDDPVPMKFVPQTLRQIVGLAVLAMFRGGLPIACAVCGTRLPEQLGAGRPRLYCSARCAQRAAYAKKLLKRQTPIITATSAHARSSTPSSRRR